jgi:radical SAM protein with 4Fe4S-binding SPASM domain
MNILKKIQHKMNKKFNADYWKTVGLKKVHFDIVDGCQLKCIGCPNSTMSKKVSRINPDVFDECLKNIDVPHISLFRLFILGEPLLHDNVPDLLVKLSQQHYSIKTVEISTNANHHNFKQLEEIFKTGRLNRLAVSCDGEGTPEEYEKYRPPAKWLRLIEFLERAKELRDRYAPSVELVTRTISVTPEGKNKWLKLLSPLGWSPDFRGWTYMPGSANDMTGTSPCKTKGLCLYMKDPRLLYIDADGQVNPCCVTLEAGRFGSLRELTFSEILKGEKRKIMADEMRSNRTQMPICGQCPH